MTEVALTRRINLYHQVAASIGERCVKIDGPSGDRLVLYRHDGGNGGETGCNHITGSAGAEVLGSGVGQAHRHCAAAEGDTNTLLGIIRYSGNLCARGHRQLLGTVNHLVLVTHVVPEAVCRQLLVLNGTTTNRYSVDVNGNCLGRIGGRKVAAVPGIGSIGTSRG